MFFSKTVNKFGSPGVKSLSLFRETLSIGVNLTRSQISSLTKMLTNNNQSVKENYRLQSKTTALTMSTVQDHCNDENGSVAMNKATKLRRLPLSRRQGNVILVSKVSANSVSRVLKRAPARISRFTGKRKYPMNRFISTGEVLIIKKPSTSSNQYYFFTFLLKPTNCALYNCIILLLQFNSDSSLPIMTTESSPSVLTCAYNNRRRNRIHPLTHPNIINNCNMNVQALKPNKPVISSKIKKNCTKSLSENDGALENIAEWSTLLSKGSTHEKAPKILSAEESSSSFRAEVYSDMHPPIFRQMLDYDDRDDTMVLKRASPIYDSDDDEDFQPSPTKRQRTFEGTTALQWGERLQETSDGFSSLGLLLE